MNVLPIKMTVIAMQDAPTLWDLLHANVVLVFLAMERTVQVKRKIVNI